MARWSIQLPATAQDEKAIKDLAKAERLNVGQYLLRLALDDVAKKRAKNDQKR